MQVILHKADIMSLFLFNNSDTTSLYEPMNQVITIIFF